MESRVTRLHVNPRIGGPGRPILDYYVEVRMIAWFAALSAASTGLAGALLYGDIIDRSSAPGVVLGFAPGMILVAALASSLTFLVYLRHELLLLALSSFFFTAGGLMLGLMPLESAAKIVTAVCLGLWISLMLSSVLQVVLISVLIIVVDFYSVFFGPTKMMLESDSRAIDYLTISMPVFAVDAVSRLGASDIVFFSLFIAMTLVYGLRRELTAIAMALSLVATMVVGVTLDFGVPALPLLSLSFLLANIDLLYRRFLDEPAETKKREGSA
ncbi:MAG: hypothetical protein ACYCXJ_04935 [Thermoleophilia bacterium]